MFTFTLSRDDYTKIMCALEEAAERGDSDTGLMDRLFLAYHDAVAQEVEARPCART